MKPNRTASISPAAAPRLIFAGVNAVAVGMGAFLFSPSTSKMSNPHITAAWKTPTPDAQSKLILVRLADSADKKRGECWPQIEKLAADTGLSRRTVFRKIDALVAADLLARETFRSGKSNRVRYIVLPAFSQCRTDTLKEDASGCQPDTFRVSQGHPENEVQGVTGTPSGCQPDTFRVSQGHPACIGEPSLNPHSTQTNAGATTTTDEWGMPVTKTIADEISELKANLNTLHPAWSKRPQFTAAEDRELFENRSAWLGIDPSDWPLLTSYMHARIPDEWRSTPKDFFQPDNRLAIIRTGPTAMCGYADRWKRKCVKSGMPTGIETNGHAMPVAASSPIRS